MAKSGSNGSGENVGSLIEIKGVVVDAVFPDKLPAIYAALRIERRGSGRPDRGGAAAPRRRPGSRGRDGLDGRHRPRDEGDRHVDGDLGAGRGRHPRPRLERPRRAGRRQAGAAGGHRALADPPRPAGLRRPRLEDRDLRDRHQGRRPDRALRPRRQGRPLRRRRGGEDGADPGADPQHRARARRRARCSRASASARARATTS